MSRDGEWRALRHPLIIGEWQKPLGVAYRAHLRSEVTQRLGWTWTPLDTRGFSELSGWTPLVLDEMSQRRRQVEAHLEQEWGTSEGLTGYQTRSAAVATRAVKSPAGTLDQLQADWRARLSEQGLARSTLEALVAPAELRSAPLAYPLEECERVFVRLAGEHGLTEKANTFTRASVVHALAGELPQGASAELLEQLASSFLEDQRVLPLAPLAESAYAGIARYTTRSLLAVERSAVELARRARRAGRGAARIRRRQHAAACVALEHGGGELRLCVGDRLVLRENCAKPWLVNGLIGSVEAISQHGQGLSLRLDTETRGAKRVIVPVWYLKAGYAEHAYAITGHTSQGATLEQVLVVARPADHSREWSYTAASRARGETRHLVLNDDAAVTRDDPEHAPTRIDPADPGVDERERDLDAMDRLEHALNRTDADRLVQHDVLSREPDQPLERGWDARLEPPTLDLGYELGLDRHYREHGRDGPGLER